MTKELKKKIEECNNLYGLLDKRPIQIKAIAETVSVSNHPKMTKIISELIKNNKRFYVKIRLQGERLWVIPVAENEQIFYAILDSDPINDDLHFNDLISFQSCDVFEIYKNKPNK